MHIPVLTKEIITFLRPENGGSFFDGTLGEGGHTKELIRCGASSVIAVDRDLKTLEETTTRLGDLPVHSFHATFDQINEVLSNLPGTRLSGILLDLGISSNQLDSAERGFSFLKDGPLDMRMDQTTSAQNAAHIVNRWQEKDLTAIIMEYGEERFAKRIAQGIIKQRRVAPIKSTKTLASLIYQIVPSQYRHGKIHPATRTFQALRIAVNEELKILRSGLKEMLPLLVPEGRIAVISFHSLEDRIIKETFVKWEREGLGKRVVSKPIVAAEEEIYFNPRARSAKLRVFEKSAEGNSIETISYKTQSKFSK